MSLEFEIFWRRRHKRASRRLMNDLRNLLPAIGVLLCFIASATVIVASEQVPFQQDSKHDPYSNISISSTSKLSAAPAGILPVLRLP